MGFSKCREEYNYNVVFLSSYFQSKHNLNHYFHRHVCPSIHTSVRHKIFFLLKSPRNHPLTPEVDPRGWPRVALGHAAPPEELARARRALSSQVNCNLKVGGDFFSSLKYMHLTTFVSNFCSFDQFLVWPCGRPMHMQQH